MNKGMVMFMDMPYIFDHLFSFLVTFKYKCVAKLQVAV